MNNEPVAWMELYYGEPNNLSWTDAELRNSGEVYKTLPLYTHPAKTLTEDTECQYCKQGCIRCDARKLLTDKEIEGIARANVDGHTSMEQLKWFARAILKKASEK
jgi:hypothetical protein